MFTGWRSRLFRSAQTTPDPQLGWKDTVLLAAGETVQLAITFPPYQDCLTPYMWRVPVNARTASTRL
jgi:hypothetical protein